MIGVLLAALAATWIAYCVLLYPLIVFVAGSWRPMAVRTSKTHRPVVTLIVTARNEEKSISDKLRNALASHYPEERLRVLLVSDGSTDRTVELAHAVRDANPGRVDVLAFEESRGKTAALMDGIAIARGASEVLVVTDANSFFEPDAVAQLVSNFADERVGCVAGELRYLSRSGERAYRGMENKLREWESRIGVSVGAEGAIYAVRADVVPELPPDLIDDFTIPLLIQASGRRVVYESRAVAHEEFLLSWRQQYSRRKRIVNRCVRSSWFVPGLYNPVRYPLASLAFLSHRMLRWTIALPVGTLLVVALLHGRSSYPLNLLALMPALYLAWVTMGWLVRDKQGLPRLVYAALFATCTVWAMLLGVLSAVRGERVVKWTPQRA